jgi:DNA invertase Pin-like site-specific DNA recombinase
MRAVIFVRVSRRDQDYQCQLQDLRAIAISMEVEVMKEIAENISGVTSNQHRAGIQQLLKLAHQGQVDKVLVQEVSRLGRSTVEVLQVVEDLTDLEVSIYVQNFGI